jgi:hypothetical protein
LLLFGGSNFGVITLNSKMISRHGSHLKPVSTGVIGRAQRGHFMARKRGHAKLVPIALQSFKRTGPQQAL